MRRFHKGQRGTERMGQIGLEVEYIRKGFTKLNLEQMNGDWWKWERGVQAGGGT